MNDIILSEDQKNALKKIKKWLKGNDRFFLLQGFAGTGKSFLTKLILEESGVKNLYFSATTNKACKVLENNLGIAVKTIYSLLGLIMDENEDKLVLKYSDHPPYFPRGSIVVIDEASMIGTELLKAIVNNGIIRVIFVGDPAQLPPVGEIFSPCWKIVDNEDNKTILREVMRNDNELLNLATEIRSCLRNKNYISPIKDDNDKFNGVFLLESQEDFENHLLADIKNVNFTKTKVIAWRNAKVNHYNRIIRKALGFKKTYEVGDIILIGRPIERNGTFIAHTDDEYIIQECSDENFILVDDIHEIEYWDLKLKNDNQELTVKIAINENLLNSILTDKANAAKKSLSKFKKDAWKEFWSLKKCFDDIRYGYAMTAHKSQGSTITECYIDQQDILSNFKSQEAFQCLYVAATRPTNRIYSF